MPQTIWLIILGAIAAGMTLFALRRFRILADMERQLTYIIEHDTNALIRIPPSGRKLRHLCRELNRVLATMREKELHLKQGDRELKEVLRAWSHDLRTPLTAVTGYVDLLGREELSPKARDYLRIISARMHVLEEITEELFAFALLHGESENAPVERLNLVALVQEAAAAFYDSFAARDLEVSMRLPSAPVDVFADQTAVMRILFNLFSNALKYGSNPITVTLTPRGRLVFENAAPGMDALEARSVLGNNLIIPHFTKRSGTGILVIRRLIEQMHGTFNGSFADGMLRIELQFASGQESPRSPEE